MDRIKNKELQVGDTVYYLAPSSSYSIKKSVITEKRENQSKGRFHLFEGCELTLADGTTIEYDKVFDSKEQVLAYIVDDLQTSVASKRIGLQTLQKEFFPLHLFSLSSFLSVVYLSILPESDNILHKDQTGILHL